MFNRRYLCLYGLFLFVAANFTFANSCSAGKSGSSGPYCGLYCLYSVIKLTDKEIDVRDLLKPEYVSSRKGSSMAELKKAATDNGLYAETFGNLNDRELKNISNPVILHVKSSPKSKEYDHYVLFLGDKDGKAKIFDPPNPIEAKPYYELTPIWDGTGLIVSAQPINLSNIFAPARKKFVFFAAIAIVVILSIRAARKYILQRIGKMNWQTKFGFSIIQAVFLAGIALFGGMVYHFTNDAGFLARAGATESIVSANIETFIPKVNADEVKNIITSGTVIVDARQSEDFEAGHIENAINIPTTLCKAGRDSKLAGKDKNSQILIYCQSKGCPYAAKVAANLADDGFKNISIYKNGWVDWQKKSGAKNENK
ncbi:MAG: hypothetical protein A2Y13_05450 [Planctomycetes bacterium GWC2_45_44]|nr:MAG: hypothetical protein A2Y13_05450 [Planctomycetes bacterium GWC2_45_44]HBR18639.1 hypothetical protein [Phycisphaerales bacterium]